MSNERITIYLCQGCGKVATPGVRFGTVTIECHDHECKNFLKRMERRNNISAYYTAVSVDIKLAARMIELVDCGE